VYYTEWFCTRGCLKHFFPFTDSPGVAVIGGFYKSPPESKSPFPPVALAQGLRLFRGSLFPTYFFVTPTFPPTVSVPEIFCKASKHFFPPHSLMAIHTLFSFLNLQHLVCKVSDAFPFQKHKNPPPSPHPPRRRAFPWFFLARFFRRLTFPFSDFKQRLYLTLPMTWGYPKTPFTLLHVVLRFSDLGR